MQPKRSEVESRVAKGISNSGGLAVKRYHLLILTSLA